MHKQQMARVLRTLAAAGAAFALSALIGCGPGKTVVMGKVTYHNAPVTGGSIRLYPAAGGSGFPVFIKSDGTFEVSDAPTGPMRVAVETESVRPPESYLPPPIPADKVPAGVKLPEPPKIDLSRMPRKVAIPAKYRDPNGSGLTWEVAPGRNVRNFDLAD
jgi:hypothetical protein